MKRTIALKLQLSRDDKTKLARLQSTFVAACNAIVPFVCEHRCWNSVALHNLCYSHIREISPHLGSQMTCNAIRKVAAAYKAKQIKAGNPVPKFEFRARGSVHFDKRTYSLRGDLLSLYTMEGRVRCQYRLGERQRELLAQGQAKEAELVHRKGKWYLHLVLDLPETPISDSDGVMGVDLGERNLATTSTGKIFKGGHLRDIRDRLLAKRARLQSNGSRSAKRRLQRVSGREQRYTRDVNHRLSKAIIKEAQAHSVGVIVLEDLTHLRKRIRAGKGLRRRLHRWRWHQLQQLIEYKAQSAGIRIVYVNPAYTSQICSTCSTLGVRERNQFRCSQCGSQQHADINASKNLCRLVASADAATAVVSPPKVAASG